jgi:hypothetical protein
MIATCRTIAGKASPAWQTLLLRIASRHSDEKSTGSHPRRLPRLRSGAVEMEPNRVHPAARSKIMSRAALALFREYAESAAILDAVQQ